VDKPCWFCRLKQSLLTKFAMCGGASFTTDNVRV
jgi:hypothetical protein